MFDNKCFLLLTPANSADWQSASTQSGTKVWTIFRIYKYL